MLHQGLLVLVWQLWSRQFAWVPDAGISGSAELVCCCCRLEVCQTLKSKAGAVTECIGSTYIWQHQHGPVP